MKYISTRGYDKKFSASEAIVLGIAPDGGLFVPESIPSLSDSDIEEMKNMAFYQISARVLSKFLEEFSEKELLEYTSQAYHEDKWARIPFPLFSSMLITTENISSSSGTDLRLHSRMLLFSSFPTS